MAPHEGCSSWVLKDCLQFICEHPPFCLLCTRGLLSGEISLAGWSAENPSRHHLNPVIKLTSPAFVQHSTSVTFLPTVHYLNLIMKKWEKSPDWSPSCKTAGLCFSKRSKVWKTKTEGNKRKTKDLSQLKEANKTWQLDAVHGPGLFFCCNGHRWDNWQNPNITCRLQHCFINVNFLTLIIVLWLCRSS